MLGPGFSSSKDLKSTISIEKIEGPRGEISKFAPIVPKVIRVRLLMQNLGVPACSVNSKLFFSSEIILAELRRQQSSSPPSSFQASLSSRMCPD